jgi:DHA1 family bicyclomycin/chloramphenicol resistance-like MFS transporter
MFQHPTVRLSIAVQTLCYAMLFMSIGAIQPVFDLAFGRAESFPYWFAGIALVAGSASLLNAALVMRLGMRRLVTFALSVQSAATLGVLLYYLGAGTTEAGFFVFVGWQTTVFFMVGMTLGNLNAIAMEPMGHVAGMAASVIGSVASVLAAAIAVPVSLAFDGTPVPLAAGVLTVTAAGYGLMLHMGRVERRLPA